MKEVNLKKIPMMSKKIRKRVNKPVRRTSNSLETMTENLQILKLC